MFVGDASSVRWRSLGRDADRNSATLAEREIRSPTLTDPRTVDDVEKTMTPVDMALSSVLSPASQNAVGPLEG